MNRAVRSLVVGSSLIALVLGALVLRDLARQIDRAVPGFLVYENGVVGPNVLVPRRLQEQTAGLRPQDRVIAVDGRPVATGSEIRRAAELAGEGARLRYRVSNGGRLRDVVIPAARYRAEDFAEVALPFALAGVLLLVMGAVPALLRPERNGTRILFGFVLGTATAFALLVFAPFIGSASVPVQLAATGLAKAGAVHLGLAFPRRRWPLTRFPRAVPTLIYGAMAVQGSIFGFVQPRWPEWTTPFSYAAVATFVAGALLLLGNLLDTALRESDPILRRQARVVLPGPLLCVLTGGLAFAGTWGLVASPPALVYVVPLALCFLLGGYAMVETNLFELDVVVRRGVAVGAALFVAVASYLMLFVVLERVAGADSAVASSAAAILLIALAPAALDPLRHRAERWLDRKLFRAQREAASTLRDAGAELARGRDAKTVEQVLRDAIGCTHQPLVLKIWVGTPGGGLLEAESGELPGAGVGSALRRGHVLDLESGAAEDESRASRRDAEAIGLRLLVPFPASGPVQGGLGLGARSDGRLYNSEDTELLEALAAQAAVAFGNARAFEEMQALERRLAEENVDLRASLQQRHGFDEIIGVSPAIQQVLAQVEQVAPTDAGVLVVGETGSGKELLVRALHQHSQRSDGPLVKIACAAVPETLFESELFGHEKGAFTGATARRLGRFELADGGTLFLDDVDTLPLSVQAKLLRAIQEGEVQRLGSSATLHVDARVIAATNRDLAAEVRDGRFRQDLYYRLAVVPIRIPPLRERPEDVPLLVQHFLEEEARRLGRDRRPIRQEALERLQAHSWPGNIRELRNVVQRAVVMSRGDAIEVPTLLAAESGAAHATAVLPLADAVRDHKVARIRAALAAAGGNQSRAAEALGMHRQSLVRTMRSLGLTAGAGAGAAR